MVQIFGFNGAFWEGMRVVKSEDGKKVTRRRVRFNRIEGVHLVEDYPSVGRGRREWERKGWNKNNKN